MSGFPARQCLPDRKSSQLFAFQQEGVDWVIDFFIRTSKG